MGNVSSHVVFYGSGRLESNQEQVHEDCGSCGCDLVRAHASPGTETCVRHVLSPLHPTDQQVEQPRWQHPELAKH